MCGRPFTSGTIVWQVVEGTARARYIRPTWNVVRMPWPVLDACHNPAGLQGEDSNSRTSGKARLGRCSRVIGLPCRALLILTGDEGAERVAKFLPMIAPTPAGKHSVVPQTLHPIFVLWVSGLRQIQNVHPLDSGARDREKDTLVRLVIMTV